MGATEHDEDDSMNTQSMPEVGSPAAVDPVADDHPVPSADVAAPDDVSSLPQTEPRRRTGLHVFFMDARNVLKLDELGREIAQIAVPAAMALAADPLASLVDTAFIGRIGTVQLAAVGVSISVFNQVSKIAIYPLVSVTTSFVAEELAAWKLITAAGPEKDDIEMAASAGAAQATGGTDLNEAFRSSSSGADRNRRGNRNRCGQERKYFSSVSSALVVGGVLGLLQALLLIFAGKPFLNVMGVKSGSPTMIPARQYLTLRAIGSPAVLFSLAMQGVFRGFKDTKTPLYATVAGDVTNIILDPIFIFVFHMGVSGAAMAHVISQYLISVILIWRLKRKVEIMPPSIRDLKFSRFLKCGTVPGVEHQVFSIRYRLMEMAGSPTQSDPELADHFEDWFSDDDLTLVALIYVNSGVLAADSRQALALENMTSRTSVPSADALAGASGTTDSEFQVMPSLSGMDTSDSLSVYTPSPLTVSNPWSPTIFEQTPWEPWPVVWELRVPVVPLPAPPLTITLRTTEGDLMVAEGFLLLTRVIAVTFCVTLAASMAAHHGPIPMAAYQICLQLWLSTSLLADGLAVAGQAILAGGFARDDHHKIVATTSRVLQLSVLLGLALSIIIGIGMKFGAGVFSGDSNVLKLVHIAIPRRVYRNMGCIDNLHDLADVCRCFQ
ncbi:hypothetical protein Taro_043603, partial [Colocasia esculenta]|nr:hypothetical protein [Colocasia esculenta]